MNMKKVIQLNLKKICTKKVKKTSAHTRHRLRNRCHSSDCTDNDYVTDVTHTSPHQLCNRCASLHSANHLPSLTHSSCVFLHSHTHTTNQHRCIHSHR